MTSMYVGGRAVSSFENCSTNVLIKVMGVKALSSATFHSKNLIKLAILYDVCYGYSQTMIVKSTQYKKLAPNALRFTY